jgi:sugar-specific transcriptional regulator TrmB
MEKVLEKLGLGNKEQIIYKLILERGKIAPALVSRLTKINRTTVYSVAKELKEKGLIIEDLGSKTLYYLPAREGELEKIITREREALKEKENSIHELQTVLKNIPESKTFSVPKIRFVDEADLESYLYEALPRYHKSMLLHDVTYWGFQDHTYPEHFKHVIDWEWKHAPNEMVLKLFTNKSEVEDLMQGKYTDRRQIKFWKGENQFTGTQWICGDYIILVVTGQRPFYLVEIHDAVLAHNMREVFKKLWESEK